MRVPFPACDRYDRRRRERLPATGIGGRHGRHDGADVADGACSLGEAIIAANTNADYHGSTRTPAAVDCQVSATLTDTFTYDFQLTVQP